MLVNKKVSQELYNDAGTAKIVRARNYIREGRINIVETDYEDLDNFEIKAEVDGHFNEKYLTKIQIRNGELERASCECIDYQKTYGACKHIIATLMKFEQTKYWDRDYVEEERKKEERQEKQEEIKYRRFKDIVKTLYNEEIEEINSDEYKIAEEDKIKIEPKITFDKFSACMKIEFKIGAKRMYKIKDLPEFYTRMTNEEFYKYGEKLEFVHKKEAFKEDSMELLEFILRYGQIMKYVRLSSQKYGYYSENTNQASIILADNTLDEIFEILKGKKINLDRDYISQKIEFIDKDPKIEFELIKEGKDEYKIVPNEDIFKIPIFKGNEYTYIIDEDKLYRCSKEYAESNVKLMKLFKENYTSEVPLKKENLKEFYSIIMPKVGNKIKTNLSEEEVEEYRPKKLGTKIFLDFDNNNYIIAEVKFCYGEEEFNPIDEKIEITSIRNLLEENRTLNILRKTGFMIDKKNARFILPDEEKIYTFLSKDIEYYMQKFEVMVTENFKTKEIKQPKLGSMGVKVENNLLSVDLSKLNINTEELQEIMQKYKLKKKYHRLKDGSFIDLEENEDVEFLDKIVTGMDLEYKDLKKNEIKLPVNRTLYLNELLKNFKNAKLTKNDEYKKIVKGMEKENIEEEIEIPAKFENLLRDYQKTGFKWLKTLDNYRFGGILADDMGLGKTIQMLSIIRDYKQNMRKEAKTSFVISPSSLALNWQSEAKKFAPELKVQVIHGTSRERKEQIQNLEENDLIITSYDLLKRDIEKYQEKEYCFKFIIADEAQYLKNSNTQNAKSIKELNAETRFALTGTPIENSLAELWSIFDFVMPGYLFSYKKFKSLYETPIVKNDDENAMRKLKMLIEPFILRRTKKQVLTELPEKTVTVLDNQMQEEQEKIYMSYLMKAKQEVATEINNNGFEKSQIKILAAITRLRQICCHPSLFIEDYKGESSKLNQCIEIIEDATKAGHKILLFSGYTSMFEIIEEQLKSREIKYFKLTGATKVDERIDLVEEFNKNPNIKIFLISLKAGGTGLNLTGADMVIHYDPWWNASAENQATDRAYRIGQKNSVQVYKLITSNSIEEKIYELQQKKSELIDNCLDTKTSFISKFTKEEIMSLFE